MARIRTIKPQFFTSEDIAVLSPLARLLYIALWCEADREGRMKWKPMTFKLRYLPADNCDVSALCQELIDIGLVRLYGDGLAYIPRFSDHQHFNPRESVSVLPDPHASCTGDIFGNDSAPREGHASPTRHDASAPVPHAHPEEGKGREGKGNNNLSSTSKDCLGRVRNKPGRLPEGFQPKESHRELAKSLRVDIGTEFVKFLDYHGSKGSTFKNWDLALNTWLRNANDFSRGKSPPSKQPQSLSKTAEDLDDWVERQKRGER